MKENSEMDNVLVHTAWPFEWNPQCEYERMTRAIFTFRDGVYT